MNIKKIVMSTLVAAGFMSAAAQKTHTVTVFQPHWYVGAQIGGQYTLGETDFVDLLSPNAQIQAGYNFNSVVGLRLAVNAWQSKSAYASDYLNGTVWTWKQKYVAPSIDATFNLSNLISGFNPNRLVNVGVFAGVGLNVGFDNDEAAAVDKSITATYGPNYPTDRENLSHLWSGTALRPFGQAGVTVDFRVSDAVSLGLEVNANVISDHYNSKHAPNADWYFNALAGVKINLGKTHTTKQVSCKCPQPEPQIVEKVVEKVVEKIVEKPVPAPAPKVEPLRRDVFFTIRSTLITQKEMVKVQEIVAYLNANPNAKVTVTGHADKGTGNKAINQRLSENRARTVVNLLKSLGIPESRIISEAKGDTVQPYEKNELNRVSICIAQ